LSEPSKLNIEVVFEKDNVLPVTPLAGLMVMVFVALCPFTFVKVIVALSSVNNPVAEVK
jgi:hypothetical protein